MEQTAAKQPVEFSCKENGCGRKVRYERKTQPGAARKRKADTRQTFAVYLACEDGHVHSYDVPSSH
jgi:hypothetical protein